MAQAQPLAVTMGEPAGIGGEILLRAWLDQRAAAQGSAGAGPKYATEIAAEIAAENAAENAAPAAGPFFVIDDIARLAALADALGWQVPLREISHAREAAACFAEALPVLQRRLPVAVQPGRPDPANGAAVLGAIEEAVALCLDGSAAGLVTNPIAKKVLYDAGFTHPGHTEFLAKLASGPGHSARAVMMLACPSLRVVPLTVHVPLAEVPKRLTRSLIEETAIVVDQALRRDFAVAAPRLALAGLNPHAGEGGGIGREEIEIMEPACAALRALGLDISGPQAADSLFHERARAAYDAVLCPTHDQALIPIKTIDFYGAVNVTLGLPVIRTSPDHGTAFDIAGLGRADARSFANALAMARSMASARTAYDRAAYDRAARGEPQPAPL